MRRDKTDSKWINVKKSVKSRDKTDVFLKILTIKEMEIFLKTIKKNKVNNKLLSTLDVAHVFPVSLFPYLCYEINNLVLINRYVHNCLDNQIDPLSYEVVDKERINYWWKRLIGDERYNYCIKKIEEKIKIMTNYI